MTPARLDILVPTKRTDFGGATGDGDIDILSMDYSNATGFRFQVRPFGGHTGTPLVSLSLAAAGSEGVSVSYDPDVLDPDTGDVEGATTIRIQIAEATLTALAWGSTPIDEPLVLYYDLLITLPTLPEQMVCYGTFTVDAGVAI